MIKKQLPLPDPVGEGAKKRKGKKYMRYSEAMEYYGISITKLKEIAREAKAVRKLDRLVLIDIEKLDAFIDTFEP